MKGLTDITLLSYIEVLLSDREKGMYGTIRARGRCPVCKGSFEHIKGLGFICKTCRTTPSRYYIDLSWKGKRVRLFSTKQGIPLDSYQQALNLLSHINFEIINHTFDPSKYVKVEQSKFYLRSLFNQWRESKSWSYKYQKQVKYAEKYIEKFFSPSCDVREIRSYDIHNFAQFLHRSGLSTKSQYNILGVLKSFLNYLVRLEYIETLPAFPTISISEPSWKWLTEDQQMEIFKHIPEEDRSIFIFMALHGCRPGEARALKVMDVDFKLEAVTIQRAFSGHVLSTTKNKRIRTIPIHPDFVNTLKRLCKDKLPEAFVFTYSKTGRPYSETVLRRLWKQATTKVGIKISMYEGLRHSWASQRASSVSVYLISKALGHSDVRVTKRYTHVDLETLRACFKDGGIARVNDRHQRLSLDCHWTDFEG